LFSNCDGMSTANYDALLIGWDAQGAMSYSGTATFGTFKYCSEAAQIARASLVTKWGAIIDGGLDSGCTLYAPEFIISVKTDNVGTSNNDQFTLPMITGTYDVDWGDGNTDLAQSGTQTHTYSIASTYEVKVTGGTHINFNNGGDKNKLIDIKNWGANIWTSFDSSFRGCEFITTLTATDKPNLNVLTDMDKMFTSALGFNTDISDWDMSNVESLDSFFFNNNAFNQPLNSWNISNVTIIQGMFRDCDVFNQPLNSWDTSSIIDMRNVFYNADSFDQDISSWQVTQVTLFVGFMQTATGLSTANYDALLIAWDAQGVMSYSGTVDFGGSTYTSGGAAEAARTSLISKWGAITDGGAA